MPDQSAVLAMPYRLVRHEFDFIITKHNGANLPGNGPAGATITNTP